jgi:hypothetical protein
MTAPKRIVLDGAGAFAEALARSTMNFVRSTPRARKPAAAPDPEIVAHNAAIDAKNAARKARKAKARRRKEWQERADA